MSESPIAVATDLSARSDRAVDRALQLGEEFGCRVTIVHVLQSGSSSALDLERAETKVRSVLPDPEADIDILLPSGSPPKAIALAGTKLEARMIVAGVARFNQIGDYFLGTAVDHVIRHSTIPVLVVKQRPHEPYRNILVPVDFSDYSKTALMTAARLFPRRTLDVLHAYHVPYEAWQKSDYIRQETRDLTQKKLDEFLADPNIPDEVKTRLRGHIAYGDIGTVMASSIDELTPDLIVMATHGDAGFRHATIGSIASSLLEWVDPDTLIVPVC